MFQVITTWISIFSGSFHAAIIGISLNKRSTVRCNRLNIKEMKNIKRIKMSFLGRVMHLHRGVE